MNNLKYTLKILILIALYLLINSNVAFNQPAFTKQTGNELDKLLSEQFKKGETGCAAIVAQKGKIVYKKAFGMANLELNVPMNSDMVFRIGSMTKQFTAIAILQLMEIGKLDLHDTITKFITDYPNKGHTITIENLLTHTSGIKSYTSDPEFTTYMRIDKKPVEVINLFKDKPLEFDPGTQWSYSNSGYFLLGYIIEKISGKTYGQYLDDNFFKPLGMTNSYFGSDSRIIMNRAAGYQKGDTGMVNASIISMTIPYSAGSILSTVEDLYKWNQALHSYRLVKKETLARAFTEYHLADGKGTGYGYGWFLRKLQGSPTIEHGGGINGFLTSGVYLPDEDVFVAVLSNSTSNQPEFVSLKMAALLIGKPYNFIEIPYDRFTPGEYDGIYENDEKTRRTISVENNKLFSQVKGGFMTLILPYQKDKFFIENSFATIEFKRDIESKVISMVVNDRGNIQTYNITDTLVPLKKEVNVSQAVMDRYTGGYQIAAGFTVTITREGDKMFAQGTGQNKVAIFAETETRFFVKAIDAQLEFVQDDKGNVSKLILYQGGRKMEGPRINEE
jgi:CubicO group peptidase (beta-lactamase class C family)